MGMCKHVYVCGKPYVGGFTQTLVCVCVYMLQLPLSVCTTPLLRCEWSFVISDVYMLDAGPVVNTFIYVCAKQSSSKCISAVCQLQPAAERLSTGLQCFISLQQVFVTCV